MVRGIIGVAGGLASWVLIATAGNIVMRVAWPDYAQVEKAMEFTPAMMLARLLVGAIATIGAGFFGAWLSKGAHRVVAALTGALLVFFIPVHYGLREKFPLWYHLAFLISLAALTPAGGRLYRAWTIRARGRSASAGEPSVGS